MKILFLFTLMVVGVSNLQSQTKQPSPQHSHGFAVVELFTSEGCSSCPSADVLLKNIVASANKDGEQVYALSFHVDYWNYLGWKDPYSNKEFSERQRRYGGVFGGDKIYTPQMVVNGSEEFVGSDARAAGTSIQAGLKRTPSLTIALQCNTKKQNSANPEALALEFVTSAFVPNTLLNVACVQDVEPSNVTKGENAGRKLSHTHVVRAFQSVVLSESKGQIMITPPAQARTVIAYVQDKTSLKILAATSLDLPK